jgi:hypothetical protein
MTTTKGQIQEKINKNGILSSGLGKNKKVHNSLFFISQIGWNSKKPSFATKNHLLLLSLSGKKFSQ